MQLRRFSTALFLLLMALGATACGEKAATKVENDATGRDRELFEESLKHLRKGRYEQGRLQLITLINTYADSPYLPLGKLAMADSFYREGGTSNLAQAESEYQNWLSFFATTQPSLACEVMYKISEIHMKQVLAPDRDPKEARAAERTLMALVSRYPDCGRTADAKARLDEVRERLAETNLRVAMFYYQQREAWAGVEDRLKEIIEKYPNFSKMDEVLYWIGQTEVQREDTEQAGKYFAELARRFPNSERYAAAVEQLKKFDMPVPEPDPNAPPAREKPGMVGSLMLKVMDPGMETSNEGILIKKDGLPDETVMQALQEANNAWTQSPTPVTTTVGPRNASTGSTTTATPTTTTPGRPGDVKVVVDGNRGTQPEKKDEKKKNN